METTSKYSWIPIISVAVACILGLLWIAYFIFIYNPRPLEGMHIIVAAMYLFGYQIMQVSTIIIGGIGMILGIIAIRRKDSGLKLGIVGLVLNFMIWWPILLSFLSLLPLLINPPTPITCC
jgi:hypothetical protein